MLRQELLTIRRELDELDKRILKAYTEVDEKEKNADSAPNHGRPWTVWDKEFVVSRFNELIDDAALKMGRTKLSIILFISRHISKGCRL